MFMRRCAAVAFLLLCCCLFASCGGTLPYAVQTLPDKSDVYVNVYVCGAVEREGYYTVEAGTGYVELLASVGILPQSVLPLYYTGAVDPSVTELCIDYYDGQAARSCIDANGYIVRNRIHVDGIADEAIAMLADYIERSGTIRNKAMLRDILGEYDELFHYKFFVSRQDYAAD